MNTRRNTILSKEWILFIVIAAVFFGLWCKWGYPQLAALDLSVKKQQAFHQAESFLHSRGIEPSSYLKAVVFRIDLWSDRYLQKTLGFDKEKDFVREHNLELFQWMTRFFRQHHKEEFVVGVSSASGEVVSFRHLIKDTEARPNLGRSSSRRIAEGFLRESAGIDLEGYELHTEKTQKFENRVDYSFAWEKKGVYVPWEEGGAKLLVGATISGDEVRSFYKNDLDIPEKFIRYVERQLTLGSFITSFSFIVLLVWIAWAVMIIITKRHSLIIRLSWRWYLAIGAGIFILSIFYILNGYQQVLINYTTSASLVSYLGLRFINFFTKILFFSFSIVLLGSAGEFLFSERFPARRENSFLHYRKSSLLSREVSRRIIFGYLLFFILLGFQSVLFRIGYNWVGVWYEKTKLTELSSLYLPFFGAFFIGLRASLNEEIVYRIFAISWAKKLLNNNVLAVLLAALVWGFGHTQYAIFPIWFRGIEVSALGLLLGFMFLRYGIIVVVVAHYLFDVFWGVSGYILGRSSPGLFLSGVSVLLLPLAFAAVAYFINRPDRERAMEVFLHPEQEYNLKILTVYAREMKKQGLSAEDLINELLLHGWDRTMVEGVIKKIYYGKR